MELVISHELIGEKCLISDNSLWNTVVLVSPLTKSAQSLWRFQNGKSRSQQEIRGTIDDNQGKVCLATKLDFFVIDKDQIAE